MKMSGCRTRAHFAIKVKGRDIFTSADMFSLIFFFFKGKTSWIVLFSHAQWSSGYREIVPFYFLKFFF